MVKLKVGLENALFRAGFPRYSIPMGDDQSGQMSEVDAAFWSGKAARLRRGFSLACWLEKFQLFVLVGTMVAAVCFVIARLIGLDGDIRSAWYLAASYGFLILIAAAVAVIRARTRFLTRSEAFARLDEKLSLNNRLSAAAAGEGAWPQPREFQHSAVTWRWIPHRLAVPWGATMLAVAIAVFLPIESLIGEGDEPAIAVVEPRSWSEMDDILDELAEEESIVDEEDIAPIQEQLDQLRSVPKDDWFSEASLEASDQLAKSLQQKLENSANNAATLEQAMAAAEKADQLKLSMQAKEALAKRFAEAFSELAKSGLKLDPSLMRQLKQAGQQMQPGNQGQGQGNKPLTPEQKLEFRERLRKGAEGLGRMARMKSLQDDPTLQKILGRKPGMGQPLDGKPRRGPGEAPLFFGEESDLKTDKIESVVGTPGGSFIPAEKLAEAETEHEIDTSATSLTAGGASTAQGAGGEKVWTDALLPDEQAVLKQYFRRAE